MFTLGRTIATAVLMHTSISDFVERYALSEDVMTGDGTLDILVESRKLDLDRDLSEGKGS